MEKVKIDYNKLVNEISKSALKNIEDEILNAVEGDRPRIRWLLRARVISFLFCHHYEPAIRACHDKIREPIDDAIDSEKKES